MGDAGKADGVLMAWRPGSEGGNGVADVLYGKVNPSGRLPVTWPALSNDQPSSYLINTFPNTHGNAYQPAYRFGAGLSYTTYTQSVSKVTRADGSVAVHVTVANTGSVDGVLLVPANRLAGFTRVPLAAGASKTVTVKVPTSALGLMAGDVDASGPPTLEAGQYVFSAGNVLAKPTASNANSITLP